MAMVDVGVVCGLGVKVKWMARSGLNIVAVAAGSAGELTSVVCTGVRHRCVD